jgi:hypothetical protein
MFDSSSVGSEGAIASSAAVVMQGQESFTLDVAVASDFLDVIVDAMKADEEDRGVRLKPGESIWYDNSCYGDEADNVAVKIIEGKGLSPQTVAEFDRLDKSGMWVDQNREGFGFAPLAVQSAAQFESFPDGPEGIAIKTADMQTKTGLPISDLAGLDSALAEFDELAQTIPQALWANVVKMCKLMEAKAIHLQAPVIEEAKVEILRMALLPIQHNTGYLKAREVAQHLLAGPFKKELEVALLAYESANFAPFRVRIMNDAGYLKACELVRDFDALLVGDDTRKVNAMASIKAAMSQYEDENFYPLAQPITTPEAYSVACDHLLDLMNNFKASGLKIVRGAISDLDAKMRIYEGATFEQAA